jgi:hypothetical protein
MIGSDTKFDYFTLSTVYSTGIFNKEIKYLYQYIDLPADIEPTADPLIIPKVITESTPTNIILGVFDSQGTPVDPTSNKLKWIS